MQILLSEGRVFQDGPGINSVVTDQYEVFWHGFAYRDGYGAGAASIQKFAEEISSGMADAAAKLKGVYFIAVRDRQSRQCYAFVDDSALYHAYYSPRLAGTSFLTVAAAENQKTEQMDPETLVELLHFGCIYSGRTLFPSIRQIDAQTIASVSPSGKVELLPKVLPDIATPADRSFEEMIKSLSESLANERVSLDLTGGIDSRLLAVMLSYFGLDFELAGSGVAGNHDLRIAERVADVLGRKFYTTYHNPERTDWNAVFQLCDGLFDLAKADRPLQLQRDRLGRGITVAISGAGGELFKDFWWLQDFPLYRLSKPRLGRLYATRIAPADPNHSIVSEKYYKASTSYRERVLKVLSRYAVPGNTQTYDRIYYGFKMQGFAGRFLTNSVKLIQVCTPYLERDSVRFGYGLRRRDRFLNRYHRRLITNLSPEAARLPTTEGGMTASSQPISLSLDLLKYVQDRGVRVMRKLGQRLYGKTYWQESADHPRLEQLLRQTLASRRSIDRLKDYNIVNPAVRLDRVRSRHLGALLTLDMLIARLELREWFTERTHGRPPIAA